MQLRDLDEIIKKLKKSKVPLDTEIEIQCDYDVLVLEDVEWNGEGSIVLIPNKEPITEDSFYRD